MTSKAERLAHELMALRLKYSDREFSEAIKLIASDSFIGFPLAAARQVKAVRKSPLVQNQISNGAQGAIDKLLKSVSTDSQLKGFVERFLRKEVLPSTSAVRSFAHMIGLEIPKKMPSRIALCEKISFALKALNLDDKKRFLAEAEKIRPEESSLQLWSNLIVRDE